MGKGMTWLYTMIHFPFLIFVKIGITKSSRRIQKRAKEIDRAVIGFPIPLFAVPVPNSRNLETILHRSLRFLKVRFYRGDGCEEWFLLPAAIVSIGVSLLIWAAYIYLGYILFTYLT